jgi:hypothetical protein
MRSIVIAGAGVLVAGSLMGMPRAAGDNPVCSSSGCSFYSPSRNISCEMSYQRGYGIPDGVYCQTDSPPQTVRMDAGGALNPCTGISCLGNAGTGTPTLGYGQTAGIGPFTCQSATNGVTCTIPSGRGFAISAEGIAPVG